MISLLYPSDFIAINKLAPLVEILLFFLFLFFISLGIIIKAFNINNSKFNKLLLYLFVPSLLLIFLFYVMSFFISYYDLGNNSTSIFSNTLILLCIITSVIALIFLGERGLLKINFNLVYFYVFLLCTIQMTCTTNYLVMLFYFELLFLPSLFFVYNLGYSKRVDATVSYLLKWTFFGSLMVLFSFIYIYWSTQTASLVELSISKFSRLESNVLLVSIFVGFGIKLPIWPFYYWLTKVHVEAPAGFSIFLSGFLVKTAFYCLSFFIFLFKDSSIVALFLVICLWGAIDASIRMWTSTDIKRLIAFATIQEMNLILLLLLLTDEYHLNIVNLFLLVHGILSSLLFFLIDQIQKQFGTRNLTAISGLYLSAPLMSFIIWVSILIFRGFPTFVKFFIEWDIMCSTLLSFKLLGFVLFFFIGFFGVLGFCRIFFIVMYGSPTNYGVSDILKKDYVIAIFLIVMLSALNLIIFLF